MELLTVDALTKRFTIHAIGRASAGNTTPGSRVHYHGTSAHWALGVLIEAVTGKAARHRGNDHIRIVDSAAGLLRVGSTEVLDRIEALTENLKKAERALSEANKKLALGGGGTTAAAPAAETVNGVAFLGRVVEGEGVIYKGRLL